MNNTQILKGDIYYVNFGQINSVGDEIWSDRPGLVISNDTSNKHSGVVTIVYLTTSKKKRMRPTHVPVMSGPQQAIAMCEQVFTVDKSRLSTFIGHVNDDTMAYIESALMFQFGINPATRPTTIFKKWENYIIRNHMNIDKYNIPECLTENHDDDDDNAIKETSATIEDTVVTHDDTDTIAILKEEIECLTDEVNKWKRLYQSVKGIVIPE